MSYVETSALKNSTIMLLYSEREEIETNPSYQRAGGVWTIEKKRLLIDSILNDYDLPKIYFHAYGNDMVRETGKRYAIIDGRQRLEAIWGFMNDDFALSRDFEYQKDSAISLEGLTYSDIAKQYPKIRIKFDSFVLPIVVVTTDGDEIELIEDMFSRLNEAVPLNAAEKRNALGGDMVRIITEISNTDLFQRCVKFSNKRYQHREAAARFLLIEESLQVLGKLIDTKKVYLDNLVEANKKPSPHNEDLKSRVLIVTQAMAEEFAPKDDLLMAQGNMTVYYLVFKAAIEDGELGKVTRRKLLDFREKLSENRNKAVHDYANASFDLLEFDRLSQQGTNDASSIRERFRILAEELGLTRTD